jgi:hypothetical protein
VEVDDVAGVSEDSIKSTEESDPQLARTTTEVTTRARRRDITSH